MQSVDTDLTNFVCGYLVASSARHSSSGAHKGCLRGGASQLCTREPTPGGREDANVNAQTSAPLFVQQHDHPYAVTALRDLLHELGATNDLHGAETRLLRSGFELFQSLKPEAQTLVDVTSLEVAHRHTPHQMLQLQKA